MQPSDLFDLICSASYRTAGDDVDYCIVYDQEENTIRLLFQGSTSVRDWINDLRFPAKLYKNQKNWFLVHRGFGDAWQSARDEIMTNLHDFMMMIDSTGDLSTPLARIQIAGHSMGGALAQLAAEDFRYQFGRQVDEVVTFGCPKTLFGIISHRHFLKAAKNWKQYRFVADGVTWCPPFFGYSNVTSNVIDRKNAWKIWRVLRTPVWHMKYGDSSCYY